MAKLNFYILLPTQNSLSFVSNAVSEKSSFSRLSRGHKKSLPITNVHTVAWYRLHGTVISD